MCLQKDTVRTTLVTEVFNRAKTIHISSICTNPNSARVQAKFEVGWLAFKFLANFFSELTLINRLRKQFLYFIFFFVSNGVQIRHF